MLWASLWCSNCKNIDYSVFLVSLFQVRKCQLKNENNQVLEIQMLCITQRIVLFLLYCFILVYSFIFLSFYCLGNTFDNVLVPASIWRWSAQQYSATFAFKCCRPSYLTIRAIPSLADVAIKWAAIAFSLMQGCLIIFINLPGSTRAFAAAILNWWWGKLGLLKYFMAI